MSTTLPPALLGSAAPSPAGPLDDADTGLPAPPEVQLPSMLQTLRFTQRQIEFVFRARRLHGEVFRMRAGVISDGPVVTSHPDHVRSLFTARPELVPSLTAESPLRPVLGPASVLTANGPAHLRQRRVLLPPFHGEAIERYVAEITAVTEREIASWPVGTEFALAPRMQAITLDVIMAGIFGVSGAVANGTPEHVLRETIRVLSKLSTSPLANLGELMNTGRPEPVGLMKRGVRALDDATYPVIAARRAAADLQERNDIMSLLMRATTEDGDALTDAELRDELLTLVLAGFETTANSLSWAWERLLRNPVAHERLRSVVRSGPSAEADRNVEAVITEAMRSRPVIPIIGRRPTVPWRLGEYAVPAGAPISMSILLLHHREDLYPDPFGFRPERWLADGAKPGTYEWIPFGGGTRRCLGAALAMAEMRVVLRAMVARLDLSAPDPAPERALHRNVTMIPAQGCRVVVNHKTTTE